MWSKYIDKLSCKNDRLGFILSKVHAQSLCLLFFIFSPNDSPLKTMKMLFILSERLSLLLKYSSFQVFVFPSASLLFPVSHCFRGWSKINLKVYDVINCLYKNLKITHVWYLQKEKRSDIETFSIYWVFNKEHFFMEKSCRKCPLEATPKPLFNFAK